MPHPHQWAVEIAAWAHGETIEYRPLKSTDGKWFPLHNIDEYPAVALPWWCDVTNEYRLQPKRIVRFVNVYTVTGWPTVEAAQGASDRQRSKGMLRIEFDEETQKLLGVEVLP